MRRVVIVLLIIVVFLSCKEEISNPSDSQISQILNDEFKIERFFWGCFSSGKESYKIFKKDGSFLIDSKMIVNDSVWKDTITDFSNSKKKYLQDFIKKGINLDSLEYCMDRSEYKFSNSKFIISFEDNNCELDYLFTELTK